METYLNELVFGFYPYLALAMLIFGSVARFYFVPYNWTTSSSQLLRHRGMRIGNNLFHIGIILLFLGHFFGLLTPEKWYIVFISPADKQLLAMIAGGIFGSICFVGISMLIYRRLFDPRIRKNSRFSDIFILLLIFVQLLLGLATIPFSAQHLSGENMVVLSHWVQNIITFHAGAARFVLHTNFIFKLHIFIGLTLIFVFPFTRLVHVWSFPIGYLFRSGYLVMRKRVSP